MKIRILLQLSLVVLSILTSHSAFAEVPSPERTYLLQLIQAQGDYRGKELTQKVESLSLDYHAKAPIEGRRERMREALTSLGWSEAQIRMNEGLGEDLREISVDPRLSTQEKRERIAHAFNQRVGAFPTGNLFAPCSSAGWVLAGGVGTFYGAFAFASGAAEGVLPAVGMGGVFYGMFGLFGHNDCT